MQALIIWGIVVALLVGFFSLAFFKTRKSFRDSKNIERSLKMVPLLIHLPPSSDDTESGSRDKRDVAEEAISQAQALYDIIASTATKGFKSRFYGQRHFTFEIVGTKGRVYFYAAVPVVLVDVVKQAVISSYPSARLEEVSEHNIFSPVGKISGTTGGELVLKESFVHPIATYQDTKRDAIQSLLNAMGDLGPEDGAGVQILLRPAGSAWNKVSKEAAKDKRAGKSSGGFGWKSIGSWTKQLLEALWRPPEASDKGGGGGPKEPKPLGALEQSHVEAIEAKTKHAGYETLIRVVASSNVSARSQSILRNLVATFALFDAPGKNGFKFNEAKDIENFVTAYIMRIFPQEISENILNSVELATIFHFPDERSTPTTQLERQASKQVDGPRNMPDDGMMLGYNIFRGVKREVKMTQNDLRRHVYIVGQTGVGKSTILENMIVQDMLDGKGLCFIDPHGDSVDKLMGMVPRERVEDVIHFSPGETDYPLGLNMFEFDSPDQKDFLIQEAIAMLYRLYDPQHQGIVGPRYEHWFRNAALTVMSDPEGSTFIDIPKVFTDNQFAKDKLKHVTDQTVLDFWNKEMASTSDYHKSEVLGWFVSKFGAFLSNEMMRNIIGQTKSAFNLREVMDDGKILFVNLSKGKTGELNSKLLGMIFVMKFQAAAMSRANVPEDDRRDFTLYVDEFQNFSTDSFATILSEARKYRLSLVVANQFISQLTDEIRDAVFGNVGTIIGYRTGVNDSEFLAKQFSPTFEVDDLVKIPNFNTVARLMIDNIPSQPFTMAALPPLGHYNPQLASALKRLSIAKHGRPKKVVEAEIFKRLESTPPPAPKFGAPGGAQGLRRPPAGAARTPGASGGAGGSSFLDEWLAKRREEMAKKGAAARPKVAPQPKLEKKAETFAKPKLRKDKSGMPVPRDNVTTKAPNQPGSPNVSGEQNDKQDIAAISKALKDKLNTDASGTRAISNEERKQAQEPAKPKSTGAEGELDDEDQIYIDKDGNLHYPNAEI